jgi:hypothetical protein
VAAFFSSVAESGPMWIVPGLILIAAVVGRVWSRDFPAPGRIAIPAAATIVLLAGLWVAGRSARPVYAWENEVVLGGIPPQYLIQYDRPSMGMFWGRALRKAVDEAGATPPSVGLAESAVDVSKLKAWTWVFGCSLPNKPPSRESVNAAREIVLLNPHFFPAELGIDASNAGKVRAYFGDFTQSPSVEAWRSLNVARDVGGAGDYLPDWPAIVFNGH